MDWFVIAVLRFLTRAAMACWRDSGHGESFSTASRPASSNCAQRNEDTGSAPLGSLAASVDKPLILRSDNWEALTKKYWRVSSKPPKCCSQPPTNTSAKPH